MSQKGNKESLRKEDYEILGFILKSIHRRSIVISMLNGCIFPSQIQRDTNFEFSTISRNLKKLASNGLIECQNPNAKTGRIYTPTIKLHSLEKIIRKWAIKV